MAYGVLNVTTTAYAIGDGRRTGRRVGLNRAVSSWVGTDDTGWTQTDPSGGGASGNNMRKVSENEYDGGASATAT